jgi:SAM-dependent methyltransferase
MKYFDSTKKQLIYINKKATRNFWDKHWDAYGGIRDKRDQIVKTKTTFVSEITKKYLKPEDGIILEGGCGTGFNVASLVNNDYKCIGVDYAERTVHLLNQHIPELDIRIGNVKNLPFKNDYFIGYWSLGVIEHFWDGYSIIASEMARVVKKGGYLFLSFPYMSPLRKLKARLNKYPLWQDGAIDEFYQFALNSDNVAKDFRKLGFTLVDKIPYDGIKGTKGEIALIQPMLQYLYDYKGDSRYIYKLRNFLDSKLKYLASHCIILIFKK